MVDDSLVYMRGFGAAPTDIGSPDPSLRITPQVFLADGRLVSSRSYPLGAALPEEGRPDPLAPHPDLPGQYLIRREFWASFFPDRTIIAEVGSTVRLRVHNRLTKPHALRIDGVADTGPIAPGATATLSFKAPAAGHVRLPRSRGRVRRADPRAARRARRRRAHCALAARPRARRSSSGSGSGSARTWTRCGRRGPGPARSSTPRRHRPCPATSCSTTAAGSAPWRCPTTRRTPGRRTRRPCPPAPPRGRRTRVQPRRGRAATSAPGS